jgi:hypothetical protein
MARVYRSRAYGNCEPRLSDEHEGRGYILTHDSLYAIELGAAE